MRPSILPALQGLSRLLGHKPDDVMEHASERWQVAPGGAVHVKPALMLANQLERIRGAEFATVSEVVRDFRGGFDVTQRPTMGYAFRDAVLLDGVLYAGAATRHLRPGAGRIPMGMVQHESSRAAFYESWTGNRWFGNWLSDDCLTYSLAESAGVPTATLPAKGHQPDYERRLGMTVVRARATEFDELILFDDLPNNPDKRARATGLRRRLVGAEPREHRGVFLLRGTTGARRVLVNELQIAEHLATRRGFLVLDPSNASLDQIVSACAGADVVAGVEGSHLVHGLVMMPAGARALVIQPPARAVVALKLLTDRQGQDYSVVVGTGGDDVFYADIDEIDRTLDLV
ncbi:MAG: glycosyltransferase family 61 protein [Novosphingobium sp.]